MANKAELTFITNAKQLLGELRAVNAQLANIEHNTRKMTRSAVAGHKKHGSALKGLALRFVGYQMVLNQVMQMQQKLVQFVGETVVAFREFQTRMAEVSTILGADAIPMMDRLATGVEVLSMKYGQATSDMAKGLYDILSAAFGAKDAIALLNTATRASIAGLSEVRTSVDIFTTVLNSYGMAAEQATNVSNILFQSVVRGKFQFVDLESALGYVVPIASQAGIAFEELMAALSTTTRHGLHLDMAARGLALAIQGIINPTEQAKKAARDYGVEMNGLALRVLGLHGWFEQLGEAVDKFGKNILGQLIRNMRSLRTAMVLAGEEGLAGFSEDLEKLALMGNATEIALNKITETSQFMANQMTQEFEAMKRDIGEGMDEFWLYLQSGLLAFTDFVSQMFGKIDIKSTAGAKFILVEDDDLHNAQEYLRISTRLTEISEALGRRGGKQDVPYFYGASDDAENIKANNDAIDRLNAEMASLLERQLDFQPFFETFVGGIKDSLDELGNLELTLSEVELAIDALHDKLRIPVKWGWGETQQEYEDKYSFGKPLGGTLYLELEQLKAKQRLADASYDVAQGLLSEDYVYKSLPSSIRDAVAITREYTKAQDESRKATELMSAAMRILQIEMLEIQLKGMMRRRGLTRTEQKQLKRIQIEQAKLRLENMKAAKEAETVDISTYNTKQEVIDNYLNQLKNENYQIQYSYDQQIRDLYKLVSSEEEALETRYQWWDTKNEEILTVSQELMDSLDEVMKDPLFVEMLKEYDLNVVQLEKDIAKLRATAEGREAPRYAPQSSAAIATQKRNEAMSKIESPFVRDLIARGRIPLLHQGTPYVQETGLAMLQQGERVTSANQNVPERGGDIIIENVTIDVKQIADIEDVEKLGALMSSAQSSRVLSRGKTRYRPR